MFNENNVNYSASAVGETLLPTDKDFLITRLSNDKFSTKINITYRSPRTIESQLKICTSTIDVGELNNLRLEEFDGEYFIKNDSDRDYKDNLLLKVESENIGHRIVSAIINEFTEEDADLGVPEQYLRANEIITKFAPSLTLSCVVLVCFSLSFWLLFK